MSDTRGVTYDKVLALKLTALAGVEAAPARIVLLGDEPVTCRGNYYQRLCRPSRGHIEQPGFFCRFFPISPQAYPSCSG